MKHLLKKISSVDSQISQISVGDTDLLISSKSGQVLSTINGHSIISLPKGENLVETMSPVLAQFVNKLWEVNKKKVTVRKCAGYEANPSTHEFIDKVVYFISKKVGKVILEDKQEAAVRVQAKSDTIGIAMDSKALTASLGNYSTQIENLFRYLDRSVDLSNILTRRKLIATMHGSDTTQKVLNSIRDNVAKLASETSNLPAWISISTKSRQKLSHRLERNLLDNDNERVYASTVLIPNITDQYEKIKSLTMKVAVAISPLIYIDDVFKENTKFPATWFLPTNNIEDLNESYGVVLSFLLDAPSIEANVIDPLNFIKVQNLYKDKP